MSKPKKPTGGKHTTPRRTMQWPAEWLDVIDAVAEQERTHSLWLLTELFIEYAKNKGVTAFPPPPWTKKKGAPRKKKAD